jgi:hypothetical protein
MPVPHPFPRHGLGKPFEPRPSAETRQSRLASIMFLYRSHPVVSGHSLVLTSQFHCTSLAYRELTIVICSDRGGAHGADIGSCFLALLTSLGGSPGWRVAQGYPGT